MPGVVLKSVYNYYIPPNKVTVGPNPYNHNTQLATSESSDIRRVPELT